MSSPLSISVVASADRLPQREQIEQVLLRAQQKKEPVRVRLPFSLYDHDVTRGYVFVRDATWNLQLPVDQTTPETIQALIHAIGRCLVAIAEQGSERVIEKLEGKTEEPVPEIPQP